MKFYEQSIDRNRPRVHAHLLAGIHQIPLETLHSVMQKNKNFHSSKLISRAHSRPTSKRDKRVRRRPPPLESRWIKFIWIVEIFRFSVGWVHSPIYLRKPNAILVFIFSEKFSNKENFRHELTFHPLGIVNPPYVKSLIASRKVPCTGGSSLNASWTAFQEYFILWRSSHPRRLPASFEPAISSCSAIIKWKGKRLN